ncbi:RimJ/RimL family protein N-acetyltransferase [Mumia flava]|uniref:RimJ/RimL family protein N-acetyltransferase n=1 Tax=Mumia flava TaxID=1348852 RepID=A0A2M9BE60_9ACTN|nr:GNAT family N-acetyltransferase [Mumia flava]PJJ56233.1 RimJ/RimL family protein N-acetyltransferase [Mumia flava]
MRSGLDPAERVEALFTDRLILDRVTSRDVDDVHAVFRDPATWQHLPAGQYVLREQSERLVTRSDESWERVGLGDWAVRAVAVPGLAAGAFVGIVGVTRAELDAGVVLNLGYRLDPSAWGRGIATEASAAARDAAARVQPDLPLTARALTANPASIRVLERVGLSEVWRGTVEADGITAGMELVVSSDRVLADDVLDGIIALG